MHSRYHKCPQCKTVGKVNRSKTRNLRERIRLQVVPVYAVYRCHNCNWRGWMKRSNATPLRMALVVGFYALIALSIVTATVVAVNKFWPAPTYDYTK